MTDTVDATSDVTPEESITRTPTPDQLNAIRPHIYNSVLSEYRKFIGVIRSLPIAAESFLQALIHLDTGMLWAKEAIHHADFVNTPLQVVTTPTTVRIEPASEVTHEEKTTEAEIIEDGA